MLTYEQLNQDPRGSKSPNYLDNSNLPETSLSKLSLSQVINLVISSFQSTSLKSRENRYSLDLTSLVEPERILDPK